jgi:hypothetical protein
MLTRAENEMLTRVEPGTPCGALMQRYWVARCSARISSIPFERRVEVY